MAKYSDNNMTCGATWHRIDLHLHSPGVVSFALPSGKDPKKDSDRESIVTQYVDQLKAQNISICAITDYNGIRLEWFPLIRDQARSRGIVVFPGSEVSFRTGKYGLHVLAIFPEETELDSINMFLQSLDRDAGTSLLRPDRTHRDIEPRNHVVDALLSLRDRFHCLLIPPHPDQENGLCKSLQPSDAAKLLNDIRPDAIEHCPGSELQKLRSTGIVSTGFLEHLATVEFSDPKRIEDIGMRAKKDGTRRATYLKLSVRDLHALKLALHDPKTRLALSDTPTSNHPKIRSLVVSGSGFLSNLNVCWNDDLNVIIGGRGAGKSAIIETLRYTMGLEPYSEGPYRTELVHHALGSGGKAVLGVELPVGNDRTRSCRISRVWGEEPRVYEADSDDPLPVRPSDLFGGTGTPTVFGQREIYAVSGSEEYRLRLLDDLIGEEANQRAIEVAQEIEKLRNSARLIIESQAKLVRREELRQRLNSINHDIGIYEKYGVASKLKDATTLQVDGQYLSTGSDALADAQLKWNQTFGEVQRLLITASTNLQKGQSLQKDILGEANKVINKVATDMQALGDQGSRIIRDASLSLSLLMKRWIEEIRPLEEELNKIKQEVRSEKLDPDRLLKLNSERSKLVPEIEELDRVETQLKRLREERKKLVTKVLDKRHEEYDLRRNRAETIGSLLDLRLQLRVDFKGQKDDYRRNLLGILKGSGVSGDAVEHLIAPDATDGIALAESIRTGPSDVQKRFGLTPGMAERLTKWLTDSEFRLFEIETLIPRDSVQVDLRVEDSLKPLERLSPGQRATAMLLLLFAQQGRLLILDQPEDDLDSRFIYDDVVQILRDQKTGKNGRHQIIAATHNPNIPVLGDAELVLVLEPHEGKTRVVGRASIDDRGVCEHIKGIMEGGEEAFRRRAEKYGEI